MYVNAVSPLLDGDRCWTTLDRCSMFLLCIGHVWWSSYNADKSNTTY